MIANAQNKKELVKKGGNTQDIINEILDAIPEVKGQTKGFHRNFTRDRDGMKKLWSWIKTNIRYEEDPLGVQWVREPARLWHDKVGDCKSFTVFIVSVLENLGIDYFVRFSNTETRNSRRVNHVYPVAVIDGTEIIIDAVWHSFDSEKAFFNAIDYSMADIYRLSGIGNADAAKVQAYLSEVEAIASQISDDVLVNDITEMTKGELARFQQSEQFLAQAEAATDETQAARYVAASEAVRTGDIAGLSGIGNLNAKELNKLRNFITTTGKQQAKAFQAPVIGLPENISGIGNIVKKVASVVLNAWKKVMNWIFKAAMPLAAPFFLYAFVKKKLGKRSEAKKQKQIGLLNWIQKTGKFDSADAVLAAARTGIIKKFGKQPEAVLNEAATGIAGHKVGAFVAIAMTVLPTVIDMIKKISSVFKKAAPAVSADAAPDLNELASESKTENTPQSLTQNIDNKKAAPDAGNDDKKGGGNALLYVGVAALAYMALQK
jgi:hypothetical protein